MRSDRLKKIYQKYELDCWFRLENYDLGNISLEEWACLFMPRKYMLSVAPNPKGYLLKERKEQFELIFYQTFIEWPLLAAKKGFALGNHKFERYGSSTIRPLYPYDYYKSAVRLRLPSYNDPYDKLVSYKTYNDTDIHVDHHIAVNLNAKDTDIERDFKNWLKAKRAEKLKSRKRHHEITQDHIDKWNKFKVLAYLDLLVWQGLIKKKISEEDMCEILYPGEATDLSRISKTLPQYKLLVVTDNLYDLIASQTSRDMKV